MIDATRKCARWTGLTALVCVLGVAPRAQAGTTVDLVFRESGTSTLDLEPVGPGGTYVADVLLTTTDDLLKASVSLSWDTSNGVTVASSIEWGGIALGKANSHFFAPLVGDTVDNIGGTIVNFDAILAGIVKNPPLAPPGVYHLGTIQWDTTGSSAGSLTAIGFFFKSGLDGFEAGDNAGGVVDITSSVVLHGGGFVYVIPEPGTAALVGLGLAGLALASRRRRA